MLSLLSWQYIQSNVYCHLCLSLPLSPSLSLSAETTSSCEICKLKRSNYILYIQMYAITNIKRRFKEGVTTVPSEPVAMKALTFHLNKNIFTHLTETFWSQAINIYFMYTGDKYCIQWGSKSELIPELLQKQTSGTQTQRNV